MTTTQRAEQHCRRRVCAEHETSDPRRWNHATADRVKTQRFIPLPQELPPEGEGADAEREPSPEPREPEPQSAPDSRAETPDAVAQPVANGTLSRRAAEAAAAAAAAAAAPAVDEGEVGPFVGDLTGVCAAKRCYRK